VEFCRMLDLFHSAAFKEFGQALAFFAVIFHGSAGLYMKGTGDSDFFEPSTNLHAFEYGKGHALEVQLFFCIGIFGVSCCAAVSNGFALSTLGLFSGFLAVVYHTLSFSAARLVGLSMASAVVSAVAIIGSFSFGYVLLDNAVWSSSMASVALTMMLLGVVGVCWCNELDRYLRLAEERSPILQPFHMETAWQKASSASKATGVMLAFVGGMCGATILVPWALFDSLEARDRIGGITRFIESFGVGAMMTSCLLASIYFACISDKPPNRPTMASCGAVLSGMIWMISTIFAMFAIRHLGYSVAYPVFHCQMVATVFWNVYLTKESSGGVMFGLSALVCSAGAVLLCLVGHV